MRRVILILVTMLIVPTLAFADGPPPATTANNKTVKRAAFIIYSNSLPKTAPKLRRENQKNSLDLVKATAKQLKLMRMDEDLREDEGQSMYCGYVVDKFGELKDSTDPPDFSFYTGDVCVQILFQYDDGTFEPAKPRRLKSGLITAKAVEDYVKSVLGTGS
jgi:hypothetical protein